MQFAAQLDTFPRPGRRVLTGDTGAYEQALRKHGGTTIWDGFSAAI
jgi:hypothetical protein